MLCGEEMTTDKATAASPFWRFSLDLYADQAVAGACIALQDEAGVDVNVLLYVLWAANRGRRLDESEVREIVAAVEDWRTGVVVPLRTARRSLRTTPAAVDADGAARLRQLLKKVELEAERLQQEALYRLRDMDKLGRAEPSLEGAAVANVKAYSGFLGRGFDAEYVYTLIAALRSRQAQGGK
jgi:uncharacterized protein (TIGR02444 family)